MLAFGCSCPFPDLTGCTFLHKCPGSLLHLIRRGLGCREKPLCLVPCANGLCLWLLLTVIRSNLGRSLKASRLTAADLLKRVGSIHSSVQRCHNVLQAVYDASPVVRAEVAVGLARLAVSHSLLFQVSTS